MVGPLQMRRATWLDHNARNRVKVRVTTHAGTRMTTRATIRRKCGPGMKDRESNRVALKRMCHQSAMLSLRLHQHRL